MYYAGVPTLVVRAKCPALISINGRVAGECGGEGYISVPLERKRGLLRYHAAVIAARCVRRGIMPRYAQIFA